MPFPIRQSFCTYLGDSSDPLSLNLYTYCGNNPVNYVDPSGHSLIAVGLAALAYLGATALETAPDVAIDYALDGEDFNLGSSLGSNYVMNFMPGGTAVNKVRKGAKLGKLAVKEATKTIGKNAAKEIIQEVGISNLGDLVNLLKMGERKDNNIVSKVDDNTQVLFRKDTDANAHPIKPHGYNNPVNHYNIEVQTKSAGGKWKSKWSFHIILDKMRKIVDWFD